MIAKREPCATEDLQVSRISDTEWRVADARLSDQSPSKVLGFIQKRVDTFEVLSLEAPDRDITFGEWKAAVEFFAEARIDRNF